MVEIKLKVGRYELWINENDLILDNGSCYQIMTRKKFSGWDYVPIKMSKRLFTDLKTCVLVYTNNELAQLIQKHYGSEGTAFKLTYWKFDTDRMKRIGYEFRESLEDITK